jgi:hypothetical protein
MAINQRKVGAAKSEMSRRCQRRAPTRRPPSSSSSGSLGRHAELPALRRRGSPRHDVPHGRAERPVPVDVPGLQEAVHRQGRHGHGGQPDPAAPLGVRVVGRVLVQEGRQREADSAHDRLSYRSALFLMHRVRYAWRQPTRTRRQLTGHGRGGRDLRGRQAAPEGAPQAGPSERGRQGASRRHGRARRAACGCGTSPT